jgi:hypothetical protein
MQRQAGLRNPAGQPQPLLVLEDRALELISRGDVEDCRLAADVGAIGKPLTDVVLDAIRALRGSTLATCGYREPDAIVGPGERLTLAPTRG